MVGATGFTHELADPASLREARLEIADLGEVRSMLGLVVGAELGRERAVAVHDRIEHGLALGAQLREGRLIAADVAERRA